MMNVLVCAGGTGGGIYPALAVVAGLRERGVPLANILWVGTQGEMEETLVPRAGIRLERIIGGAIVGVPLWVRLKNGLKLVWSLLLAWRLIGHFKPDVMLMTGGYLAVPVAVAAWLRRVPIAIFLPDVEPGAAIKAVLPLAQKVACTTDGSAAYVPADKMVVTGYPVRPDLRAATQLSKAAALAQFELTPERPTLFVFGGSRGAWHINEALMVALPTLLEAYQVIHVSGTLTWPKVKAFAEKLAGELRPYYRPYPYLHERMGAAFRAADLVVARSGAGMLGEAPVFGVPAILVPLTFAWRYQKVNADYLSEHGAAVQLTDETLAEQLLPTIVSLLDDVLRRQQMGAAAAALDKPTAATNVANMLLALGASAS